MKRILLLALLLCLLPLLVGCGAEPVEIELTPLEPLPAESTAPSPVLWVRIRTPFGPTVSASLPSPEPPSDSGIGSEADSPFASADYVLNIGTKRFHETSCPSVYEMKPENRQAYTGSRDELLAMGYQPCGRCKP